MNYFGIVLNLLQNLEKEKKLTFNGQIQLTRPYSVDSTKFDRFCRIFVGSIESNSTKFRLWPTQSNWAKFQPGLTRPNLSRVQLGKSCPIFGWVWLDWIRPNSTKFCSRST